MVTLTVKNLPNCIIAINRIIMPTIIIVVPINAICPFNIMGSENRMETKTPIVMEIIIVTQR
jgi:hypothetical protein